MTIEFNCPHCDSVIGFAEKHAGKRAQCTTCGRRFIIPEKSYAKAKIIKPPKEVPAEPISGFYRAVLIDNWKIFINPKNITGFAFILTAVVFKFFTANRNLSLFIQGPWLSFDIYIPFGWACRVFACGFLFWYYREIIYSTGFDEENFPEVILGGFYSFVWKVFESVYTLFIILLVVGLPAFIAYFVLYKIGSGLPVLLYSLLAIGVFLMPGAIMNIAIGKDLTLLRPDYLFKQAFRDFVPNLIMFVLLAAAIFLQVHVKQYDPLQASGDAGINLFLNCAVQMLFVYSIRSIGLFYRHYSCHPPW